jgi:hypothetical protein
MTSLNQTDDLTSAYPKPFVFPNPARNFVRISTLTPVQVFNVSGQLVTTLKSGHNDIRNLSKGIYFVKFRNKFLTKLVILNSNP